MHRTSGKGSRMGIMVLGWAVGVFVLAGTPLGVAQQAQQGRNPELIRLKDHPLQQNQALGARAARLGEGRFRQVDVTLIEIPPGGNLSPHRHLAEEMIYVVSGSGYTMMWPRPEIRKERYDWKEGDLVSPSLNTWHQHFNGSPTAPVRYLAITTAPLTQNLFHNSAFLSASDFLFEDRWNRAVAQQPQYTPENTTGPTNVRMKAGHLLPNLRGREMLRRSRDQLGITILPEGDMAANELLEMEVREFTAADGTTPQHRHVWETVYYVLKGDGYATLQKEGGPERRLDWTEGDLFLVEANEYHNHRPRGVGGRFLQIKASGYFERVGLERDFLMQDKPR
ncbi:MAG: cupin domain-containing protein [Terriglobia bacterium]